MSDEYVPWHEKINGKVINFILRKCVLEVQKHGLALVHVYVTWDKKGGFDVQSEGRPLVKSKPDIDESVH